MVNCPACHRDTYSKKWDACSAEDCSLNHAARAREVFAVVPKTKPVSLKSDNHVVFHVEQHGITRRKDGICPRCDERPKGGSGYCKECHAARARETRALQSSGRPPGRPRKGANAQ